MGIGTTTPAEGTTRRDPETGVRIRQVTDWQGHSHHLYFTNSGLWDDGRQLLFGSHRHNARNFYSVELATGEITQLTDFGPDRVPHLQRGFVNPVRDEAYFTIGKEVWALGLRDGGLRRLYEGREGYNSGNLSCTADGLTVCHALHQDLSDRIRMDTGHGYIGFAEYSAARPHCQIVAIPVDGGDVRVIHEEQFWLSHINTSPTLPDVLTFCHEGPWRTIDQRMWTLSVSTGQVRPLRRQEPGETIGHEYWFADGQRVGYHGRNTRSVEIFGSVNADDTDRREFEFPHGSTHFHSMDEELIVGDGTRQKPHLLLWKLVDGRYAGARQLLTHRGSWHVQFLHVHPRMFADGDGGVRIVYTADPRGYGNVYIAEVPEFESLPELDES
ncbi:MAG: oligogalacturonate lyase family protein [Planctomycetota bacterium]|jgi:oligogalacturonide lyase